MTLLRYVPNPHSSKCELVCDLNCHRGESLGRLHGLIMEASQGHSWWRRMRSLDV